jgi:GT2 family glycosyltransferase
MELISINVLNTNEKNPLERCLRQLKNQTYKNIEITVIDNGSTDGSLEMLEKTFPDIKVIKNGKNLGYCMSHNIGIANSKGEYVMPLNADIFLEPDYVENAIKAIKKSSDIGMVQGKLLKIPSYDADMPKDKVIDSIGIQMYKARRNFERDQGTLDNGQFDREEYVFGASGAAPLYKREMLEDIKIGDEYFDNRFFIYRDEIDLSWRAQLLGWKCLYTPDAVAYHVRYYSPEKRKKVKRKFRRIQLRNRYWMIMKNDTVKNYLRNLPTILWFEFRQWCYAPVFEPHLIIGLFEAIKYMPEMMKKRKIIMSKKKVDDDYINSWFI